MTKKILLHVKPDGTTKIEAEGYEGEECLTATAVFEGMFSRQLGERELVGGCGPAPDQGERVR